MIWIFMEGEGDEIKSKQASKRDRTLLTYAQTILYEAKQDLLLGDIGSDLLLQERIDLGNKFLRS